MASSKLQKKARLRPRRFSFWITCFVLFTIVAPNLYSLGHVIYEEYWIYHAGLHISDDPDQIYKDALRKLECGASSSLVEDLGAAIEKFPKYHKFRKLRGALYHLRGDLAKAKKDLTIAYDFSLGYSEFHRLMNCLFAMKEYSDIIMYCDDRLAGIANLQAEFADIGIIEVFETRARAYLLSEKYQDAINDYDFILLARNNIPSNFRERYLARVENCRAYAIDHKTR